MTTTAVLRTAALALLVVLAACSGQREPLEPQLKAIRSYGWPASVVDPDPDWNPASHLLVARSMGGFSTFEEGGAGERRFAADDRRESHHPRWLNREQFVFGPGWNARRGADGAVSTPSEGITVVTMRDGKPESRLPLSDRGYRPQPSEGVLIAQEGNRILVIDARGRVSEFGEGFDPVPQPDGPGLAWRDRPAFDDDWWTGGNDRGCMLVRWSRGRVDTLGDAVQAAWTRHGGLLATMRLAPPAAGQPWWSGGSEIIHLPGPGAPRTVVRRGARDPAPHPFAELLAWTGDDGGVWIGTLRADGWSERIAVNGSRPRWSHDGLRVCWLEAPPEGSQIPGIRVTVLAVR